MSAAAVGVTAPRVAVSTGAARRDARLPSAASLVKTRGPFVDPLRATPGGKEEAESREVLDAFFVGKALAEVLLEKAGEAVSEALSTVGRLEAERDEAVRQFQEDVLAKARDAQRRERGGKTRSGDGGGAFVRRFPGGGAGRRPPTRIIARIARCSITRMHR